VLHRMNPTAWALTMLAALLLTVLPARADDNVIEYELDNGLDVILRPVTGAKQTAVLTLLDIGELHDPVGQSGKAHLMEHLLITGATDASPPTSADQWMMQYDGQANAQTGLDYTVIAGTVDADSVGDELKAAAARLQSLSFDAELLEREKQRVYTELENMYRNMPWLVARNTVREIIDPAPEGARRGGVREQIESLSVEDLAQWHDRYYKPNNATLILVGAIDVEPVRQTINEQFGDIARGAALPPQREQASFSRPDDIVHATAHGDYGADAPDAFAMVAYRAPEPDNAEELSTFLLVVPRIYQQMIAAGVRTSRFVQPVQYAVLDDPGAVYLRIPLEPGDDGKEVVQRIRDMVERASTFDTRKPLNRGPLQHMYGVLLGLMRLPDNTITLNLYGEAFRLGRIRQLGIDPDAMREVINDMTADGVNDIAAGLFSEQRSVAVIVRSNE